MDWRIGMNRKMVKNILEILENIYPEARCELNYNSPFQLLIATMLSAQTTDKMVNKVTQNLFLKYPAVEDFLTLKQEALEKEIKEIGLYRNKAKNILKTCEFLVSNYSGIVPKDLLQLIELPGVGRKTANVVLSNAFEIPAIAVDTHVFRVSNRIGLARGKTPDHVEKELMENIPKRQWGKSHHLLIWHGRRLCHARKPNCVNCALKNFCGFYRDEQKG
jgi:endonuclease-3